MITYSDIENLCIELPEDIRKRKCAGDFTGARRLIALWLLRDIPNQLKSRLQLEQIILDILPQEYTLKKEEAFEQLKEAVPDITLEEFDKLRDLGKIDWIYVNGEEYYFRRFCATLLKVNPDLIQRAVANKNVMDTVDYKEKQALQRVIDQVREEKNVTWHFHIRAAVKIKEECFQSGKYCVHIPIPAATGQIHNINIKRSTLAEHMVAREDAPQRTIYFEKYLKSNEEFFVEYEYDNMVTYQEPKEEFVQEIDKPQFSHDLREQLPHITFTPYLRSLAAKITEGIDNPLRKARAVYNYITTNIEYSFMREYFSVENLTEYAALSQKGDCGVQSLLFITLCRILSIPARWQSGLYSTPYHAGSHDWAQFYIAPYGWLFADCSFGGDAVRNGDLKRQQFYFGNLDPFRMPANSEFQMQFEPPKKFLRADPYDNQRGEVESEQRGLSYNEFLSDIQVLQATQIYT